MRERCDANVWRWADKYFELLGERKVKGYLFQEKNYFEKQQ